MVAAVVDRVALAFEHARAIPRGSARRTRPATSRSRRSGPRARVEKRIEAGCCPVCSTLTAKCGAADQRRRARRLLGDADQQQRRIERHRGEAVDGQPDRLPVLIEAGDDRHAGREAAERVAQGARVGPGAIFALVGWSAIAAAIAPRRESSTVRRSGRRRSRPAPLRDDPLEPAQQARTRHRLELPAGALGIERLGLGERPLGGIRLLGHERDQAPPLAPAEGFDGADQRSGFGELRFERVDRQAEMLAQQVGPSARRCPR